MKISVDGVRKYGAIQRNSHLNKVFPLKFDKEVYGIRNIWPTQQKSHLYGVPVIEDILYLF